MTNQHRTHSRSDRGTVLIAVLVCLTVASAITGVALQSSLRSRRHMNVQWQLEQTRLLLDAGIRRAMTRGADNPDYEGESWSVDDALEAFPVANVEIRPTQDDASENSNLRLYRVTALIQNRDRIPVQTKRSQIIRIHRKPTATPLINP
ncbi:hypothetical protein [Rhodopirellula sallentina]|uniref:Putative membrane or secreted protein n=1 Tax=Rhodopirellula sallentina SM41 TaxID=1263870 RepID=M5TZW6_9BACT|nr:hypothetical protein [Rhodopirellula sallentina]EMI54730.1 putative membrane or secreted protein [Rhodopirellula sallentina SM41]